MCSRRLTLWHDGGQDRRLPCPSATPAAQLERFVEVNSPSYPDLRRHYEAEVLIWIEERLRL